MIIVHKKPTYGELIDLFEVTTSADDLYEKFHDQYPNIKVGRVDRFFDTVSRIIAPTKLSLTGKCSLTGSPLISYRKRHWELRIRNKYGNMQHLFIIHNFNFH